LSGFNEAGIFSKDFWKNTQMSNFTNIRPVGVVLFHCEGTDGHAFGKYATALKKN